MLKLLIVTFLPLSFSLAIATPNETISGSKVNGWVQAGLRVTDRLFDLGIQGDGFFVLMGPNEKHIFSRYGEFKQDVNGYLVDSEQGYKLLGSCDGTFGPIKISRFARDSDESIAKQFRVTLKGTIEAVYANGFVKPTCKIPLAIFRDPTRLKRTSTHLLFSSKASGEAFIDFAQSESRGSIYSSTLEELTEQIYRLNINGQKTNKIADEMEKSRVAMEYWAREKTLFYVYELKLTRNELSQIESAARLSGQKINRIVASMQMPPTLEPSLDDEYNEAIKSAMIEEENRVYDLIGPSKLARFKKFRAKINDGLFDQFGANIFITGF